MVSGLITVKVLVGAEATDSATALVQVTVLVSLAGSTRILIQAITVEEVTASVPAELMEVGKEKDD